jgi:hypothetical protein
LFLLGCISRSSPTRFELLFCFLFCFCFQARDFFPRNWLHLMDALGEVDVRGYVAESPDKTLRSAWAQAVDGYAAWNGGLLGKHLQVIM